MIEVKENKIHPLLVVSTLFFAYLALVIINPYLGHEVFKYFVFQVVMVVLPSFLFARIIGSIAEEMSFVERVAFGYPVCIAVTCLLYFVGESLNNQYVPLLLLSVSLYSIVKIVKLINKSRLALMPNTLIIPHVLLSFFTLTIFFVLFTVTQGRPIEGALGAWYQDSLWTIGNTWSAIRGTPNVDARFSGVPFDYHMLQNIYYAVINRMTGVDPFYLHLFIAPFFELFMIVSSVVLGGYRIARYNSRCATLVAFILLFSCSFYNYYFYNGYLMHIYANPLSLFFGFSSFVLLVYCVENYFKNGSASICYMGCLFWVVSGTKLTLMVIVPVSLALVFALQLVRERKFKREVVLGLTMLFVILLVKITIFRSGNGSGIESTFSMPLVKTGMLFSFAEKFNSQAEIVHRFLFVLKRFLQPAFLLIMLPSTLLIIVAAVINERAKKHVLESCYFFFYIVVFTIVSLCMQTLFELPGASYYFVWYPVIMITIYSSKLLSTLYGEPAKFPRVFSGVFILIAVISFGNVAYSSLKNNKLWNGLSPRTDFYDLRATIDYSEWQGLNWIKNNTPQEAVFVSDRVEFSHERTGKTVGRFYAYSALSGRQMYNEGYEFNNNEKNEIAMNHHEITESFLETGENIYLDKINADYLIKSIRFNGLGLSNNDHLNMVFENPSLQVYEIVN